MMGRWSLVFLLMSVGLLKAQENTTLPKGQVILDSLSRLSAHQWLTDSLSISAWSDSLRSGIINKATANVNKLNSKIDSLNNLNLPTEKYQHKLDSITQKSNQLLAEITQKQEQLLGKTKGNLAQWQEKLKLNAGQLNAGVNLPASLKIPELGTTDFNSIKLSTELLVINQQLPFGKLDGLSQWQQKMPGLDNLKNLNDLAPGLDAVPGMEQANQLKDIKSNPDKLIETAATNIDGVQELKDKLNAPGMQDTEFGKLSKDIQNPEAMKEAALEKAKQEAINHFAGKEQVLQQAMQQVSKLKMKYSSINSLSEIPKKRMNPMKGKPLRERLVPGVLLQFQWKFNLLVDVNPYVGYRITDKLTTGLGWNHRVPFNLGKKYFTTEGMVYGPRAYSEYRLGRGFIVHINGEALNSPIPTNYITTADPNSREWVFNFFTGLKREFRISKNIKGIAVAQYNLVKHMYNASYAARFNSRVGIEFKLTKKKA